MKWHWYLGSAFKYSRKKVQKVKKKKKKKKTTTTTTKKTKKKTLGTEFRWLILEVLCISSLTHSLIMSNSLRPHEPQHARPPWPSPSPEFTQTHVHWVGDAIQPSHPCRPLLLLPSIFPSIRVFSNESALLIRWPKYWNFSFNISPSNEHPGLISFRMDWLDLLAVQGILKSLLQHHSSKSSILQCSAFFTVQL